MFLLSPEADMRPGDLQARVLKFRGQMRFGLLIGRQYIVSTRGSPANKGRLVLRLRRTGRTRIIAESQRNGDFSLADSQPTQLTAYPIEWREQSGSGRRVGFEPA